MQSDVDYDAVRTIASIVKERFSRRGIMEGWRLADLAAGNRPKATPSSKTEPSSQSKSSSKAEPYFRYMEYIGKTAKGNPSQKFWSVKTDGNKVHVRWGKIGSKGQSKTYTKLTSHHARIFAKNLVSKKVDKGYSTVKKKR